MKIACGDSRSDGPSGSRRSPSLGLTSTRGKQDTQVKKKLYVGNLPFSSTEDDLRDLFGRHGAVESVNVIMDRETGRPRGFAFVEMEDANAAQDAIRALDGSDLGGRSIRVNEAQDRRGGGGGGGGYRGNR
jgi:RNA recognition motif-containing protein